MNEMVEHLSDLLDSLKDILKQPIGELFHAGLAAAVPAAEKGLTSQVTHAVVTGLLTSAIVGFFGVVYAIPAFKAEIATELRYMQGAITENTTDRLESIPDRFTGTQFQTFYQMDYIVTRDKVLRNEQRIQYLIGE